jgi:aerobic-type carbon monoxide dehydrogenase small subunit (CoxS/CutS family)
MDSTYTLTVNGQRRTVTTDSERPLLHVLREDLHLTGAKLGCGEGQCGACTVLVDGQRQHACILPIKDAAQKTVITIEGLGSGDTLHPVQQAFFEAGAMQCGFCTSGMILATVALLRQVPDPSPAEILAWMNPHVCRCCGYTRILEAVQRAASAGRR